MNSGRFLVLIGFICLCSCGNEDFEIIQSKGVVVDTSGITGLEDCGFMIRIEGELYKPTYLNSQYELEGLEVLLNVEFLSSRSNCTSLALPPQEIRVEQIRPAN